MKFLHLPKIFFSATILILSCTFSACSNDPSDGELQQSINDTLRANPALSNVTATVTDGKVTLTGTCEGDDCVAETERHKKEIEGVEEVQNSLTMAATGTDLTLRTQVQSITSRYAGVQADVANGVVVLRGSIARDQLQSMMSELNGLQASKIDNQLVVK